MDESPSALVDRCYWSALVRKEAADAADPAVVGIRAWLVEVVAELDTRYRRGLVDFDLTRYSLGLTDRQVPPSWPPESDSQGGL